MLTVPQYKNPVSLIPGGVMQMLDFRLDRAEIAKIRRAFREERLDGRNGAERFNTRLICLERNEGGEYVDMVTGAPGEADYELDARKCLDFWMNAWTPLPVLRTRGQKWEDGGERFEYGPGNWARCRFMPVSGSLDELHLVVVFDMTVESPPEEGDARHALSPDDVSAHATFQLAHHVRDNAWFLNSAWVDEWLFSQWTKKAGRRDEDAPVLEYLASYLTLLEVVRRGMRDMTVQVINPERDRPVEVDLVLDIGNSRTTGMLVETLPQKPTNLNDSYLLQLRDLDDPRHVYAEPFETRVEFAEAGFGSDALSRRSGRRTPAFPWPSLVRVGPEAARLATQAVCAEGSTGMSSPKRYLWDERPWTQSWRYNTGGGAEPMVTRGLIAKRVNQEGSPLACLDLAEGRRNPRLRGQTREVAFESRFTRSSIMMFMVVEILLQALMTINSPGRRGRQELPNVPRALRRVIFTVPPGMPVAEQRIYRRWVNWAVRLLWDALGWQDCYVEEKDRLRARPDFRLNPAVRCNWDEATCTQLVYLYNELTRKFQGDAHHLFGLAGKRRDDRPSLRVAAIDIGGGTTDLSITTFFPDNEQGAGARISPRQEFRDSFTIAGDDILREVITEHVLPALAQAALGEHSRESRALIGQLCGRELMDNSQQKRNRRAQFVRQVAVPVALSLLGAYEQADLINGSGEWNVRLGDLFEPSAPGNLPLLPRHPCPGRAVLEYVHETVRRFAPDAAFSLPDAVLRVNPRLIDKTLRNSLRDILQDLCEVVRLYDCDILLLTGRPSRWPGVVSAVLAAMPVPPSRIIPMSRYSVGGWYPFADAMGAISDPKSTVVVGAILCSLAEARLEGFSFDAGRLLPRATARFIGEMDIAGQIRDASVWFTVDPDNPDEQEPAATVMMNGPMAVGFRQLEAERWPTTRFYYIDFADERSRHKASSRLPYKLELRFVVRARPDADQGESRDEGDLLIESVTDREGGSVNRNEVEARLQTLPQDDGYWLDTGIAYRNA